MGLRDVLATGGGHATVLAAGVLELLVDLRNLFVEVGDLAFVQGNLCNGFLVGTGQVAVVAKRGDGDECYHGYGEVEAHSPIDAVPVAVKEGGRDELADL